MSIFQTRYINLILYTAYSELRAESERTYIGYLWWVIEPVIYMAIYYIVFALFFNRGTEDFVPFLFVGLVTWRWMQSTLMHGSNSILAGRGLMSQVYIPKITFPTVSILTNSFKFIAVFVLLLFFLWVYGYNIGVVYLALPILLMIEFLLIVALTYIFAAITPFFPDTRILLDNTLRGLLFLSGIFYAGSSIPERFSFYFYLNPMATLIESYREILLYNHWPTWQPLAIISVFSLLGIVLGANLIVRSEYTYPKVV